MKVTSSFLIWTLKVYAWMIVLGILAATHKGKFILMLRLYCPYEPPQPSIIDGSWKPPAVKKVQ